MPPRGICLDSRLSLIWSVLGVPLLVLPPYIFERFAQYYFLISSRTFGIFSGDRLYFEVIYLVLGAMTLGYYGRTLLRAWSVYVVSVAILIILYFGICTPILCYSPGIDGLEAVRMGSFFLSGGIATAYLGRMGRGDSSPPLWQKATAAGCAMYAIAYNPVVFTLAGVRLISPFDPLPVLVLLATLSFVVCISL